MPREFLANELIKEIEESGEIPPTLETAKRYISKARNTNDPLDKPWSIACCSDYSSFFSPDSIPILISYKEWIRGHSEFSEKVRYQYEQYRKLFGFSISDITIRQAIWIVRLEPLIKKLFADEIAKDESILFDYTFSISLIYEIAEITCEILNEDFTSLGLDNALTLRDLDTLAKIGALGFLATARPANCNYECETCRYMRMPGSKRWCIPRPEKEGEK
jgi:hypothetical protein